MGRERIMLSLEGRPITDRGAIGPNGMNPTEQLNSKSIFCDGANRKPLERLAKNPCHSLWLRISSYGCNTGLQAVTWWVLGGGGLRRSSALYDAKTDAAS